MSSNTVTTKALGIDIAESLRDYSIACLTGGKEPCPHAIKAFIYQYQRCIAGIQFEFLDKKGVLEILSNSNNELMNNVHPGHSPTEVK